MRTLSAESEAAFNRVLLRAEGARAGLLAFFFGALTVALGARIGIAFVAGKVESPGRVVGVIAFVAGMAALELWLVRDARRRLAAGEPASDLAAYTATVIELGAFVAGNVALDGQGDGAVIVLVTLVALSAFRMNVGATLLAGAAGAAGYLVLAVGRAAPSGAVFPDVTAERAVWSALLVLAAGGAFARMTWAVRRAALTLAQESTARQHLQADLLDSVEATQALVGRELHDGVGSHLTGLSLYTRGLGGRIGRGGTVTADEMGEVSDLVDDALQQVRQLSRGLMPSELTGGSLPSALADLADVAARTSGKTVVFHGRDARPDLAPGAELHLFRIAQEALTNALRHGDAGRVGITLATDADGVQLTVDDDGRGLPPGSKATEGVGLRTMRHRAKLAGGAVDVLPGVSRGVCVRVTVPPAP